MKKIAGLGIVIILLLMIVFNVKDDKQNPAELIVAKPSDESDYVDESNVENPVNEVVDVPPVEPKMEAVISEIDEAMQAAMLGKSYHDNEHIKFSDLRLVKVVYYGFDDLEHQGQLIVHKEIAQKVLDIFEDLHKASFPIEKIELIDIYDGDDNLSMVNNNTSAFNYRVVEGTSKLSNHSYGLAIDINPLVNPYVTKNGVYPVEGTSYVDREVPVKGMIFKNDVCYEAFVSRGFSWGGDWKNSKDYQHFDIYIKGINQ
ncbi:M15 family metallopeptidase [Petrocella sp. FN5]|uniref:M15 family metallopeptidase n=1 Tax=Petrocella sp. FN5 TaxID=3032002 RepID=UPI0023DCD5B0|nr:M15 family metallopeptidase [Petrocella sp. FN5]MDF1616102.1 M15 family metallopeptidase [Petrocella sp. FN5]